MPLMRQVLESHALSLRREGRGGQVLAVEEIALRTVGPPVADAEGQGHFGTGGYDGTAVDGCGGGNKAAIFAGDFKTAHCAAFGGETGSMIEVGTNRSAFRRRLAEHGAPILDGFAV